MLDSFTVVNRGGIVLWQKQLAPVSTSLLNSLISDVFIAGSSRDSYAKSGYTIKWTMANELGLIFVVVYQSLLQLQFVEEFLDNMKKILVKLHGEEIKAAAAEGTDISGIVCNFEPYFEQRLADLEEKSSISSPRSPNTPIANGLVSPPITPITSPTAELADPLVINEEDKIKRVASPKVLNAAKIVGGRRAGNSRRASGRNTPVNSSVPSSDDETVTKKPAKTKTARRWREDGTVDDSGHETLDFSTADGENDKSSSGPDNLDEFVGNDEMEETKSGQMVIKDLNALLRTDDEKTQKSGAFSFFSNLVSGKTLTGEDLAPVMENMRQHLLAKNIANEVCVDLCTSVSDSLIGQKTGTFSKTSTLVQSSMDTALRRILTPTTSLDLLNEISRVKKAESRPYTMSFIGVNGVGKSTNLSKIAYWLLGNKLRVLIVACDTFRSGAVEQLRVHVVRLRKFIENQGRSGDGVELFERGYGKDPSSIANDAIQYAKKGGFDVVLVDTAGRRHNDVRLMSGLERFVSTVKLDKIFQVAEALVGTDSISQARHFNDALGPRRNLDGFIISKVDTVGELVGTLVSMIYVTGVPVVFVGVGQMYTDLRGLSVEWVVQMLLS
ncbi:Putative uncharacterized protein [Taphrina deformans PYCC 5710]|uniref:Signal recognition particle receptor subunit alpha homolog n=1 Tax=Taphrina deformans (strain PYCC 5710 / ATCC 11124 / CBS 356.35 / IMI 108563 / JCM 9778 / NBRC 8474) TaxID=1097556 RepID=R4X9L1_TAPDE|nr:Putative uncharacterized protein [Taphrina deformans PYCC 5710]|eukprot:CCG82451.1 Putative uncharacterized protein [Taphrina deformans PYCC 5710]